MGECSWKGSPSRFWSVQTEALRVRRASDYHLNIQEGACYCPASEIYRPQLLLGQQERRKRHRDQRPQKKGTRPLYFQYQQSAFGPAKCVRAAIRIRSAIRVGAGNAHSAGNPCSACCLRLARHSACGQQMKARLASKARFTSRAMFHQQNDVPPANALTTSKRSPHQQTRFPNAPGHSGRVPTGEQHGEQAGPDGTPPKALNYIRNGVQTRQSWNGNQWSWLSAITDGHACAEAGVVTDGHACPQ